MFRPARVLGRGAEARDLDAARAMQSALDEAEEWAAHATALARVLRETKAAAKRLERSNSSAISSPLERRTLH